MVEKITLKCKKCGKLSTWYGLFSLKYFVCPHCGGTEYEIVGIAEQE